MTVFLHPETAEAARGDRMPSRRDFLACAAVAAGALLLPPGTVNAAPARVCRRSFLALIGRPVHCVGVAGVSCALTLMAVRDVGSDPRLEQFTLLFEGRADEVLPREGGLVHLLHPASGPTLVRLEPSTTRDHTWISDFSLLV